MVHHIHKSIKGMWAEGELSTDWRWFLIYISDIVDGGCTRTWARGESPIWSLWAQRQPITSATKSAITAWIENGSECNWKGLFPPNLCWVLQQIGVTAKRTKKWVAATRDLLLDGA
jgi:hypothetical protein